MSDSPSLQIVNEQCFNHLIYANLYLSLKTGKLKFDRAIFSDFQFSSLLVLSHKPRYPCELALHCDPAELGGVWPLQLGHLPGRFKIVWAYSLFKVAKVSRRRNAD